jgi:hypothetical protein
MGTGAQVTPLYTAFPGGRKRGAGEKACALARHTHTPLVL